MPSPPKFSVLNQTENCYRIDEIMPNRSNFKHDLESYFESPALQGFQNNLFFSVSTKEQGLALPSRH